MTQDVAWHIANIVADGQVRIAVPAKDRFIQGQACISGSPRKLRVSFSWEARKFLLHPWRVEAESSVYELDADPRIDPLENEPELDGHGAVKLFRFLNGELAELIMLPPSHPECQDPQSLRRAHAGPVFCSLG